MLSVEIFLIKRTFDEFHPHPITHPPSLSRGNRGSNWNNGNDDMTILPPGKSIEMPLLQGPGVITHHLDDQPRRPGLELNALSLRVFWDGANEPAIQSASGRIFHRRPGHSRAGRERAGASFAHGALSCFWRMPFSKSARIVVCNDNPNRSTGLYWQVDWVELNSLPQDTPRFYARYRQEYPAVMGRDYAHRRPPRTRRLRRHRHVRHPRPGRLVRRRRRLFYIDGESVPSLQGTGSEDYFNDAWGFRPRTGPWFGQPRWQGDYAGDSGIAYRWHVLDPVGFTQSLKLAIEHKGNYENDIDGFFIERPDFINSVAFWYQVGEPKPFGQLPPYPERCVPGKLTTWSPPIAARKRGAGPGPKWISPA